MSHKAGRSRRNTRRKNSSGLFVIKSGRKEKWPRDRRFGFRCPGAIVLVPDTSLTQKADVTAYFLEETDMPLVVLGFTCRTGWTPCMQTREASSDGFCEPLGDVTPCLQ